jgi:YbbR domain-containing protein
MSLFQRLTNRFSKSEPAIDDGDEAVFLTREKIVVFALSFVFAFFLWFIVNLSRDYNVDVQLPITIGNMPADKALSGPLPEFTTASLNGEGWKLINVYNNPPGIVIDASNQEINLFDQVRQQLSVHSDVNIMKVTPLTLNLNLEDKITKTVPVISRIQMQTRNQYGITSPATLSPDSVTITGAVSRLQDVTHWETEELLLENVAGNIEREVAMSPGSGGIRVQPQKITYNVGVSEFTEAEIRIPIRTRNLPPGMVVTYNPSTITVRFDVPIEHYQDVQNSRNFVAYVDYAMIRDDSTGLIAPQIERVSDIYNIRIRSFQPSRVSYFNVIQD